MAKKTKNEIEAERQQLAADEAAFSAEDAGRQEDELAERVNAFAKAIYDSAPDVVETTDGEVLDATPPDEIERRRVAEYVRAQHDENGQPVVYSR